MRRTQPWKTNRSRVLRANETSAEAKLWDELHNRRLAGQKFVRQAAVGPFFADSLCRERRIVVKIDGGNHGTDDEIAADQRREQDLARLGYRVFRAGNEEIYSNMDGVIGALLALIEEAA